MTRILTELTGLAAFVAVIGLAALTAMHAGDTLAYIETINECASATDRCAVEGQP